MNKIAQRIEKIKREGYTLDFGEVFNSALENYKKIAVFAGSVLLLFTFLLLIIAGFGMVKGIGIEELNSMKENDFAVFQDPNNIYFRYLQIASVILAVLIAPFLAAFLKMAQYASRDEEFKTAQMFSFYKWPYIKEIVLATLVLTLLDLAVSTAAVAAGASFVGTIFKIALALFTMLTIPLIVFQEFSAFEAIKTSITVVLKNPLVIFALLIVGFIGSIVGLVGCIIGVFFTYPIMYSISYSLYETIFEKE
ncbi:hypothetical protein [Flavobacterium sp. 14A]|uniref:hypothetical protein n=1 Tax=Flavobacterium sp. 14A TaxID=2735896 RepID=UPI00156ECAB1|nr:hypothetical protein [Flavobacterium sp. 14A]NRT12434.1 putative membrane protein [Flavobacterium sp. 14A]